MLIFSFTIYNLIDFSSLIKVKLPPSNYICNAMVVFLSAFSLLQVKYSLSSLQYLKLQKKKVVLSKTEGNLAGNMSVKPALHCVVTLILSKSN